MGLNYWRNGRTAGLARARMSKGVAMAWRRRRLPPGAASSPSASRQKRGRRRPARNCDLLAQALQLAMAWGRKRKTSAEALDFELHADRVRRRGHPYQSLVLLALRLRRAPR